MKRSTDTHPLQGRDLDITPVVCSQAVIQVLDFEGNQGERPDSSPLRSETDEDIERRETVIITDYWVA